jgi:prophage antirepressor-like protein
MNNLVLFEQKQVRRLWNAADQKWYFSVQDVIEVLTGSADIRQYVKKLKSRDPELSSNWGTICTLVEMTAADGKRRKIQAANVEGLLRLIQSIPSPKAEPFKRWLAKVGYERLQEIENPELASQRMREIYQQKGYSAAWIEKRMQTGTVPFLSENKGASPLCQAVLTEGGSGVEATGPRRQPRSIAAISPARMLCISSRDTTPARFVSFERSSVVT